MKTEFEFSPQDEAVVNHSDAEGNEGVTNNHDPLDDKFDKPGREEDPDTTRKEPDWDDQPKRENDNDKSGDDDNNDRTGTDTDNDKTAP